MEYYAALEKNGDFSLDFGREKSPCILSEENKTHKPEQCNSMQLCVQKKKEGRNETIYLYMFVLALT